MNPASPLPRPLPLFAIALAVLLAHGLLLAWLVFTPTALPRTPEQRMEWVTLEPAKPQPKPPTPVAAPKPAQPAPPKPRVAQAARQALAQKTPPIQRQLPAPHPPPAPTATPQPAPPPHAPSPAQTAARAPSTEPAAPSKAAEPGHTPSAVASAPPTTAPAVETAASYKAEYLDNPPPPYPRLSRQLGEEGTALLKVQVGPDGRALQIKLMSSTGFTRLDEAAEATVAQWRFVAATRNGQAITSWVLVPIKFRILN